MILPTGKLDSDLLKEIVFGKITYKSDQVRVRPGIGEDCAVLDFGEWDCIMSTDPITAAVKDIGRLSIHITCNDIASNGVQPVGIMLAVMLPEGTSDEDVRQIMEQAGRTAEQLKVEIIGGHTEITPAVKQPVIVSTALGKCPAGGSQSGSTMVAGDYIMMTKTCGLEGAGIIATDHEEQLLAGEGGHSGEWSSPGDEPDPGTKTGSAENPERIRLSAEEVRRARSFLDQVSVVKEGVAAGRVGTHGMHDITEGGILGAVWEMCQISGTGAEVWEDKIPLEPETRKICRIFGLDPLRLISSGSMVMIVGEDKKEAMERAMEEEGVRLSTIGRVCSAEEGINLIRSSQSREGDEEQTVSIPVDPPSADEIYRVIDRT